MNNSIYCFIDGSALMAQIRQLRKIDRKFKGNKVCLKTFSDKIKTKFEPNCGLPIKRIVFYFPNGSNQEMDEFLIKPKLNIPGDIKDFNIKFCGTKMKTPSGYNDWVASVPEKFQQFVSKSEKGIDIEICCDILKLVTRSHIGRLFILTNDSDFVPCFRTAKEFGANINLFHLSDNINPNNDLLSESDGYDVFRDEDLGIIFKLSVSGDDEDVDTEDSVRSDNSDSEYTTKDKSPDTPHEQLKSAENEVEGESDD